MCETLQSIFFRAYSFFQKSTNCHTAPLIYPRKSNAQCNALYNGLKDLISKDRLVPSEISQELSQFHREKAFLKKIITIQDDCVDVHCVQNPP